MSPENGLEPQCRRLGSTVGKRQETQLPGAGSGQALPSLCKGPLVVSGLRRPGRWRVGGSGGSCLEPGSTCWPTLVRSRCSRAAGPGLSARALFLGDRLLPPRLSFALCPPMLVQPGLACSCGNQRPSRRFPGALSPYNGLKLHRVPSPEEPGKYAMGSTPLRYSPVGAGPGSLQWMVLRTQGGSGWCKWRRAPGTLSPSWSVHQRRASLGHWPQPGQPARGKGEPGGRNPPHLPVPRPTCLFYHGPAAPALLTPYLCGRPQPWEALRAEWWGGPVLLADCLQAEQPVAIVLVAGTHHTDGVDETAWCTDAVRGPCRQGAPCKAPAQS